MTVSKTKFASCIVDTGGKFAICINDTSGTVANWPVSFIPVVHLDLRESPRIFEKIRVNSKVIFRGLEEDFS
jgi:hypothetical protein